MINNADDIKFIKNGIGNWISENTQIISISDDTYEIATTEIDSYGDTIYCFVKKMEDLYQIGDEGRILFKLDPGADDVDLYRTAEEIAIGAGFDFDEETCEISVTTDKDNLVQAIIKLSQLQIAISYLG